LGAETSSHAVARRHERRTVLSLTQHAHLWASAEFQGSFLTFMSDARSLVRSVQSPMHVLSSLTENELRSSRSTTFFPRSSLNGSSPMRSKPTNLFAKKPPPTFPVREESRRPTGYRQSREDYTTNERRLLHGTKQLVLFPHHIRCVQLRQRGRVTHDDPYSGHRSVQGRAPARTHTPLLLVGALARGDEPLFDVPELDV